MSRPIVEFNDPLRALAGQMLHLMRQAKGVGLAAPQVGKNIRLFVMNPTGEAGDDHVYVNPVLSDIDGRDEAEEGCLSLPDIHVQVVRGKKVKIQAQDLDGTPFEQTATGFITRVWQHEFDHLNGILITDRMGPVAKMTHRKRLKELEDLYKKKGG
jgi:peptide deformylase